MNTSTLNRIRRALSPTVASARVLVAAALVAGAISACDVHGVSSPGTVSTILVTPNGTMATSATLQMIAVGHDADGRVVTITPTWSVAALGGTISSSGMFTSGTTAGVFPNTVVASVGTITGSASITVTAGPIASIVVSPTPSTLAQGATQQFTAVAKDAGGNVVAFTPAWSVAAAGGTINSTGLFTAGATAGTFTNTVVAASGAISGTASVVVTSGAIATIVVSPTPSTLAQGATQQFTAVAKDASGNVIPFAPTWSIVAGGGAIDINGLFTAGATAGTFTNTVKAASGAISGTASVVVTSGAIATIVVSPTPATLAQGATQQFSAVAKDAGGNVVAFTPTWSIVAGGGTIDINGLFTAGATAGTFTNTVKAASGATSGTASVVVTSGAIATIVVSPTPATMMINGTQQFTAVAKDAGGNVITPFTPTWSVVASGGAVSSTGLFTAGTTAGTFTNTVKAASGAISGLATVTVTPGAVATIAVTPTSATVLSAATQQFVAVAKDVGGNVIAPFTPTWSIVAGGGAIDINGLFTAGATGGTFTNTVKAGSGAISGFATVIVTPIVVPIVNLLTAAPNGIMAGTAVTCITGGTINADVSVSPGNTITGFGPCVITGVQHLGDAVALQGQTDLTAAYNTLAGLPCPPANAIVANLGGTTMTAGVYCTASGIGVTGVLTLDGGGDPNANFVFQAGSSLTTAGNVVLINSAQAKNVYWVVGTSATLGVSSLWQGNILTVQSITLVDNATLFGRALARNGAVSLGTNNTITLP